MEIDLWCNRIDDQVIAKLQYYKHWKWNVAVSLFHFC